MGITIRTMTTVMGRSGKPERLSFFPIRAHLLTTARRAAVVSLPLVGSCALPEASTGCFSRGGRQFRSFSNCRHCLCGWQKAFASFASSLQITVPALGQPAIRLRKPATAQGTPFGCGSFLAVMGDASPAPSIFFCLGKRNKSAPCGAERK